MLPVFKILFSGRPERGEMLSVFFSSFPSGKWKELFGGETLADFYFLFFSLVWRVEFSLIFKMQGFGSLRGSKTESQEGSGRSFGVQEMDLLGNSRFSELLRGSWRAVSARGLAGAGGPALGRGSRFRQSSEGEFDRLLPSRTPCEGLGQDP